MRPSAKATKRAQASEKLGPWAISAGAMPCTAGSLAEVCAPDTTVLKQAPRAAGSAGLEVEQEDDGRAGELLGGFRAEGARVKRAMEAASA